MNLRATLRATPALLRVGLAEAAAYRAEVLVWVLSTTMPLVMLALWTAVAREAPVGRYGEPQFVAYFLSTFIVRQLTGCWVFWEMNSEIRDGTMASRLLRPVHPLWSYAAGALASMPVRLAIALPLAAGAIVVSGARGMTHDPMLWALWTASVAGAWAITLFINFVIGCASFFIESSLKVMDAWLVVFFVFSGYLIPVDLFPPAVRAVADVLPFRYQIGLPVELMTGAHGHADAVHLLAGQWAWVGGGFALTVWAWRRGIARFAAYGG